MNEQKTRPALINQSERYGADVEVTGVNDYLELNPEGDFRESGKLGGRKIIEHFADGTSETVAKIVWIER